MANQVGMLNVVGSMNTTKDTSKSAKTDKQSGDDFKSYLKDASSAKDKRDAVDNKKDDKQASSKPKDDKQNVNEEEETASVQENAILAGLLNGNMAVVDNISMIETVAQTEIPTTSFAASTNMQNTSETGQTQKQAASQQTTVLDGTVENVTSMQDVNANVQAVNQKATAAKGENAEQNLSAEPMLENGLVEKTEPVTEAKQDIKNVNGNKENANEAPKTELPKEGVLDAQTLKFAADKMAVKVGDGANKAKPQEAVNVYSDNFQGDLADKIVFKATDKTNTFDIQLTPNELGKINIKVVFEGGHAEVTMVCSNPKTMSLLAENARGICSIIEANTGNTANVIVQENKEASYDQQQNNQDNSQSQYSQEQNQQQDRRQSEGRTIDFIQQLRLGLVNFDDEEYVRM